MAMTVPLLRESGEEPAPGEDPGVAEVRMGCGKQASSGDSSQ